MAEAEAKLRRETPPGGSRVETLRKLFEGDASSKMALDPEEVNTGSSGSSGPTAYRRRKGKGKTPERSRRPAGGHPHDSDPFFTASDGDERGRRHRRGVAGGGGGDVPLEPEGESEDLRPPYQTRSLRRAGPRRPGGATWTRRKTWTSTTRRSAHPRTHRGDPAETHRDPLAEDHQDPLEDAHQVDHLETDHRAGEDPLDRADPAQALLEDPLGTQTTHQGTATRMPPGGGLFTSAGGSSPSSAK